MSTTDATPSTVAATTRAPRDVRRFWRLLLAVIAPLPMLAMGVYNLLSPVDGDASFEETLAAYAADPGRAELLQWIQVPFLVLLVPATFAVAWVARRRAPRLATAGALLALTGLLAGFGILPGAPHAAYLTVVHDLDAGAVAALDAAISEDPTFLVGGLLFILAITFGLLLLGVALWRSRVAPVWAGPAIAIGGFTHPFLPGHVLAGLGLLVAAAGYAGVSIALVRMRDDEFDLPPLP